MPAYWRGQSLCGCCPQTKVDPLQAINEAMAADPDNPAIAELAQAVLASCEVKDPA